MGLCLKKKKKKEEKKNWMLLTAGAGIAANSGERLVCGSFPFPEQLQWNIH